MPQTALEALRLLNVYTANRPDPWNLAGPQKASCRAHVMAALLGVPKVPQSKAGVTAIRAEFYRQLGIGKPGECEAERGEQLWNAAKLNP